MNRTHVPEHRRIVRFGSAQIEYVLTERVRRDLAISVHPDLSVTVVAPPGRRPEQVDAHVQSRARWILRQQLRFRDHHPLPSPKRYVSGESHRYLGRQIRLRVVNGSNDNIVMLRPILLVSVQDRTDQLLVKRLVDRWFRTRAEDMLTKYFERFVASHPQFRPLVHGVRIRRMKMRWGSCSPGGTITLNPLLIHCPPSCIEYVIAHELCHRRVMNHGQSFVRLLTRMMPDWRSRKERLNRLGC